MAYDINMLEGYEVLPIDSLDYNYDTGVIKIKSRFADKVSSVIVGGQSVPFSREGSEILISWTGTIPSISLLGKVDLGIRTSVSFGFSRLTKVEGPTRVLQRFLRFLLTTPGTDELSPQSGVGLKTLINTGLSKNQVLGVLSSAIYMAEQQTKASESDDWPESERLDRVEILSYSYDEHSRELFLEIRIVTMSGSLAKFSVKV